MSLGVEIITLELQIQCFGEAISKLNRIKKGKKGERRRKKFQIFDF